MLQQKTAWQVQVRQHHTPCSPSTAVRRHLRPAAVGEGFLGGIFGKKQAEPQASTQPQQPQQAAPEAQGTVGAPEFPPYRVLQKGQKYDLRFYDVYPVVEMDYQRREEGYLALGSYQDGANSSSSRFGHTQPVTMCYHTDGRKVMQMMVGTCRDASGASAASAGSSKADAITALPTPSDPQVRLAVAGGELVAVMPFEGYITPETAASVRQQLINVLNADGLQLAPEEAGGFFRVAQYGQVYTLQARLNELLLRVQL